MHSSECQVNLTKDVGSTIIRLTWLNFDKLLLEVYAKLEKCKKKNAVLCSKAAKQFFEFEHKHTKIKTESAFLTI